LKKNCPDLGNFLQTSTVSIVDMWALKLI